LTTFPDEPLNHEYDLNTTDICPVGALTGKHFRFQQRVWMLKSVESIDPSDALGANLTIDYNISGSQGGKVWRLMPRRNPNVNKSWIANRTRMLYQQLAVNRLTDGKKAGVDCTIDEAQAAAVVALKSAKRVAIVTSGHLTTEDNIAALALAESLGAKAEVFGGSWLTVGKADGIALSGDPVANRKGVTLLGIKDNFDALVVVGHDLWAANADKAAKLEVIPTRIVLSSWVDQTVAKATIAIGIRAWAEVRGSMVNINGVVQLLQACPVVPNSQLEAAWSVLVGLSSAGTKALSWTSEVDAWKAVQARVPQFAGMTYRSIGPMGCSIDQNVAAQQPVTAGA
jgi:NADH-quinone oxidoreductase subunit G